MKQKKGVWDMEQNTLVWLEGRKKGIGSSDAPIIMGKSQYMTPYQLFIDKISPVSEDDLTPTFVQELGHIFEPKALAHLSLSIDVNDFYPTLFEHKEVSWLKASLDGYSESQNIAVEIKYVGRDRFAWVKENSRPLEDHWDQVQHILLCSGAKKLIYCCYTLTSDKKQIDDIYWCDVFLDRDYIDKELFPAEQKFWKRVLSGEPPELCERDEKVINDDAAVDLANVYRDLLARKKEIEKTLSDVEAQLKEIAAKEKCSRLKVGDVSITRSVRKGSVDYKSVPELQGVDLDKYRKAATTYFTLRV
jgi:putative phage-type endonuclease